MGYLKYQLEGEQVSFGNGEWFFTGDKRKSDKVVGRYTSSESCEGQCKACNIVTARYSNGETYSIPYDCNAANSYFNLDRLLEVNDYLPISAITSLEFGDCVTRIDGTLSATHPSFDSLTSITFSNSSSLKAIGESFYNVNAPQLTEIRFPNSLTILDNRTFAWNMPNLQRVFLNEGIKWIGINVFRGTKIRELVIPSTVEHLGSIEGSDKLVKATFISETPPRSLVGSSSMGGFKGVVYVPCGSVNEYIQAFEGASWYELRGRVTCEGAPFRIRYTMSDGLKAALPCNDGYIGSGETKGFIDEDVVNIEFSECTKTINTKFSGFTSLHDVSLTIPNANICMHAFEYTSGITSLTIGSGCTFEITNATEYPFASMPDLKRVTLEEGLTLWDVGGMFAGCTSLTNITISNSITVIPYLMFNGCTSLTSMTIPDSVTSIGYNSFASCTSLTSITIPDSVRGIGYGAFYNCPSLTSVTIGNSVTSIGYQAFSKCTGLTSITIEATTPPSLGSNAFNETNDCPIYVPCDSVSSYINSWGSLSARIRGIEPCNLKMMVHVTYIEGSRNDYIRYCDDTSMYIPNADSAETVTYGDCVTSIGESAFSGCTSLTSVTIPNSVTSIGDRAFYNCSGLTSVNIPDSVTSIGSYAFNGCSSITSITIGSGVTSIGTSVFSGCRSITSITIPDSVTSIGDYALDRCSGLTSITIPDSVTSISNNAFQNCTGLVNVTIGSGVTSISYSAFYNCSGLTSITIPDNVTSIGSSVFYYCSSIANVTIGSGITSISNWAFAFCSGLTSITIPDSVTTIGNDAFYKCTSLANVTIGSGVTSIGDSAFAFCSGLTSITIPDSVTSIGEDAFYNCSGLTSVTVNASTPPTLGYGAFDYTNDCQIYVPSASVDAYKAANGWSNYADRIKPIEAFAYKFEATYTDGTSFSAACDDDSSLTTATTRTAPASTSYINMKTAVVGNCVVTIGGSAFSGCTNLTSVAIPNSVTNIGERAFRDCSGLISVTIPSGLTSISRQVFYGCSGLTSVTIPNSVTTIGDFAFGNCSGLTSVTILDGVTSIGDSAFRYCTGLVNVTIGSGVTSIGQYVFQHCSSLTSITVNAATPPTLGNNAFTYTNDCPIYVPAASVDAYKTANRWSEYASRIQPIPNS